MQIIHEQISLIALKEMAPNYFEDMVKGVVDIQKELLAVDAELHSDLEQKLIETGSAQANLWGINLYPGLFATNDFLEFDSMINLKPAQNNRSRGIEDEAIRNKVLAIVQAMIKGD